MLEQIKESLMQEKTNLDIEMNKETNFRIQSKLAVATGRIEDAISYIEEAQKMIQDILWSQVNE